MSITIDYTQVRTVEEGPKYKVSTTVTYVSGIAPQIFVKNTETQEYEHVATVWDMEHVVPDRDTAVLNRLNYYRDSSCFAEYETESAAMEFATYTSSRIQSLVTDYSKYVQDFAGTFNYSAESVS